MSYERRTKDIIMKIKTVQQSVLGEEEPMELLTEAKRVVKNGAVYLIYEETELSGIPGCVTSIRIEGEEVRLRRFGTFPQEMRFEVGKRFLGLYDTPVGMVDMEITTNSLKAELADEGTKGTIFLDYNIKLRGLMAARNTMEIKLAPTKESKTEKQ